MAKMLWGIAKAESFNLRTGSHLYPMKIEVHEDKVTATGGAHQYQDGPGPTMQHNGYDYELRPEDFPANVPWNYVSYSVMGTFIADIQTRHFDSFEEFVAALN